MRNKVLIERSERRLEALEIKHEELEISQTRNLEVKQAKAAEKTAEVVRRESLASDL
jgi:hypothetical protein